MEQVVLTLNRAARLKHKKEMKEARQSEQGRIRPSHFIPINLSLWHSGLQKRVLASTLANLYLTHPSIFPIPRKYMHIEGINNANNANGILLCGIIKRRTQHKSLESTHGLGSQRHLSAVPCWSVWNTSKHSFKSNTSLSHTPLYLLSHTTRVWARRIAIVSQATNFNELNQVRLLLWTLYSYNDLISHRWLVHASAFFVV